MLDENPDLASELKALLKDTPEDSFVLQITVMGDNNTVAQVAGNNKKFKIS